MIFKYKTKRTIFFYETANIYIINPIISRSNKFYNYAFQRNKCKMQMLLNLRPKTSSHLYFSFSIKPVYDLSENIFTFTFKIYII